MQIQYLSDLHLEFPANKAFIREHPSSQAAETLVMAGDVLPFVLIDKHRDFFDYLSDHFAQVYWLPGNHEYYHSDAAKRSGSFREAIRPNVHLLNNQIIQQGKATLIFSTLWSKLSPANWWRLRQDLNDFRAIKYDGYPFSFDHVDHLYRNNLAFIETALRETPAAERTVVISHHVPTFLHYPEMYKDSPVSEAFATELYPLIETAQPACWLYGHHHVNVPAFNIGRTQLLTNQLGYVHHGEHQGFDVSRTLEI